MKTADERRIQMKEFLDILIPIFLDQYIREPPPKVRVQHGVVAYRLPEPDRKEQSVQTDFYPPPGDGWELRRLELETGSGSLLGYWTREVPADWTETMRPPAGDGVEFDDSPPDS